MMADRGCQLDYIWNQLKPKQQGRPMRDFPDWIISGGKTYPKSRSHFLMAPHIKGHRRRKPFCLLALTLTDKTIHSVAEVFLCWAGIRTYFGI